MHEPRRVRFHQRGINVIVVVVVPHAPAVDPPPPPARPVLVARRGMHDRKQRVEEALYVYVCVDALGEREGNEG